MIKKFESIDSISINYPNSSTDIQFLECSGILRREDTSEKSGHIRSKEAFGRFQLPQVGKVFNLIAEPFDKSLPVETAARIINTSEVIRVEKLENGLIHFWTLNSMYSLQIVPATK